MEFHTLSTLVLPGDGAGTYSVAAAGCDAVRVPAATGWPLIRRRSAGRRGLALAAGAGDIVGDMVGATDGARGVPCWIGLKVPGPLSDRPDDPWRRDSPPTWFWLHQRILAGLEIHHFDLAPEHVDVRATVVDRDAELRALHHGGEIRRLDLEMLDVALFDLEQDRTGLLNDGGRHAVGLVARECRSPSSARSGWSLRRASAGRGRSCRCGCCRRASGSLRP